MSTTHLHLSPSETTLGSDGRWHLFSVPCGAQVERVAATEQSDTLLPYCLDCLRAWGHPGSLSDRIRTMNAFVNEPMFWRQRA